MGMFTGKPEDEPGSDPNACKHYEARVLPGCYIGNAWCPHCGEVPLYIVFSNQLERINDLAKRMEEKLKA